MGLESDPEIPNENNVGGIGDTQSTDRTSDCPPKSPKLGKPRRFGTIQADAIELALADALTRASKAGEWGTVSQLARELEARRGRLGVLPRWSTSSRPGGETGAIVSESPALPEWLEPVVGALVERVAERVAERVLADLGGSLTRPRWVTAKQSPLDVKTFQRLAKSGELPTFRVGRRVVAELADVERWIRRQRVVVKAEAADDPLDREIQAGALRRAG